MPATPQSREVDIRRHPHPFAVGPEAEQGAKPDPEIHCDHVLDLGGQSERVVAETQHCVLNHQADAVQAEQRHPLFRRARSLAMPEAPVPIPQERDYRCCNRRDRHRGERAEPERAVERDEDEVGGADADQADDQELGTLMEEMPEMADGASGSLDEPWGGTGTAQCGFPASSPVEEARSPWVGATASAGSSDSCPAAGCRAAHTHLR